MDRIDVLLRTLRSERHLRRVLLEEIAQRLALDAHRSSAADAARALLVAMDHGEAVDFDSEVGRLELLAQAHEPRAAEA